MMKHESMILKKISTLNEEAAGKLGQQTEGLEKKREPKEDEQAPTVAVEEIPKKILSNCRIMSHATDNQKIKPTVSAKIDPSC